MSETLLIYISFFSFFSCYCFSYKTRQQRDDDDDERSCTDAKSKNQQHSHEVVVLFFLSTVTQRWKKRVNINRIKYGKRTDFVVNSRPSLVLHLIALRITVTDDESLVFFLFCFFSLLPAVTRFSLTLGLIRILSFPWPCLAPSVLHKRL